MSELPLHQQLLASKKTCTGSKKEGAKVQNIQPNVSAYSNGVPPRPYGGPRSRPTGPKKRNRCQKPIIWQSKKIPWVQHKYMQHMKVQKIYIPTGSRKHTGKSPTFLVPPVPQKSCQVQKTCTGPKQGCPGPKNMHPIKNDLVESEPSDPVDT